jgi:uncharacterized protein YmfQ (DUF2313 family)
MSDRHVRRSGDDYADAFAALLPQGPAWPKRIGTALMSVVTGLAQIWGYVDSRAADLLEIESDPRYTIELLPEWERAWGLPDPCFPATSTIEERRRMLLLKMTMLGQQSIDWFMWVAQWLGMTVTISEYAPFMAGISQAGDTRPPPLDSNPLIGNYRWYIGPPQMRFYWTVHVGGMPLAWFRSASGQAGIDPHLRIGIAESLECLFRRWKPAHTEVIFDYSGAGAYDNPMAGTP